MLRMLTIAAAVLLAGDGVIHLMGAGNALVLTFLALGLRLVDRLTAA